MFPTVTSHKESALTSRGTAPDSQGDLTSTENSKQRSLSSVRGKQATEHPHTRIHIFYWAHREGNLCEDSATDELDCGIVLF